jgi:hypothetical protein
MLIVVVVQFPRAADAVVVRSVLDGSSTIYDDASRVTITNPLYDGIVSQSTQPMWQARSITVRPGEFVNQRDLLLQAGFGEPMRGVARFAPPHAWIFSLELIHLANQLPITELDRAVTLEFEIPESGTQPLGDRFALYFFDNTQDQWLPAAAQLERCGDQRFCGKTNQLAPLSVIPVTEPNRLHPPLIALVAAPFALARRRNNLPKRA